MRMGTIGHYFVPNHDTDEAVHGPCNAALVTFADTESEYTVVSLISWYALGNSMRHSRVRVTLPSDEDHEASFHLIEECPWGR